MTIELTATQRSEMMVRALEAFDDWLGHCTDGELADVLTGNYGSYTNMPDLVQYLEPIEREYFESIHAEGQRRGDAAS